jgi:hypothetical protein
MIHNILITFQVPRRLLVGGMSGSRILIPSPLLKWYLEHGLEVTHIYEVVEYCRMKCFLPFVEMVSDARRAGDRNPAQSILGDTMKLIGNSGYVLLCGC